jgi:hypothetical protein
MPRISALAPLALALIVSSARADITACTCALDDSASMEVRWCSLCRVAEEQNAGPEFFFLKDHSPQKPNRWLLLPRAHWDGPRTLAKVTAAERTRLWTAAIERARALWGEEWGLALNGDRRRSQCHFHVHIGKLLPDVENGKPLVVDGPAGIPVPEDGSGLWIHPFGRKLHVHTGEDVTELVLLR